MLTGTSSGFRRRGINFPCGRMPERYEETLKQHYKTMPDLFRRLDRDREYREEVERGEIQAESKGEQN